MSAKDTLRLVMQNLIAQAVREAQPRIGVVGDNTTNATDPGHLTVGQLTDAGPSTVRVPYSLSADLEEGDPVYLLRTPLGTYFPISFGGGGYPKLRFDYARAPGGTMALTAATAITLTGGGNTFTLGATPSVIIGGTTYLFTNIGLVKVSSNDTTPGVLNGKLVAGTSITLTENNNGGNETLTIDVDGSGFATTELDNLGTTAINNDLTPDSDASYALGGQTARWLRSYTLQNFSDLNALRITNASGATANAFDVGYIDAYGDYKTTTTQADPSVRWCVVVIGGADASQIYVADRGVAVVNYTGSAPNDEDFLVTSTVAGSALAQSYCSPAVFARCIGAGSGGTVQVRLLTQRQIQRVNSAEDLCRISAGSGSNFTGTINGTPSGATLVYTITGGTNEDNITPASAAELAKIVLHNTTRGDSVLIDSVDTGTNTITATANIPGTWANTDVITTRSQTNTDTISSMYFTDYDLSSADNDKISRLAVFITGFFSMSDVGTAAAFYHPYETGATSKRYAISSTAGARLMAEIPIVNNKFCVTNNASGAGTCLWLIRPISCVVAAP